MRWIPHYLRPWAVAWIALSALYLLVLGAPIYFLWMDPLPFRETFSGPYAIERPIEYWGTAPPERAFMPGETVYIHREFCLSRPVGQGLIRRWLREPSGEAMVFAFPIEALPDDVLRRGCRTLNVATLVPNVPPGAYEQAAQWQIQINPLRTALVNLAPVRILVAPGSLQDHRAEDLQKFRRIDGTIRQLRRQDEEFDRRVNTIQRDLDAHRKVTEPIAPVSPRPRAPSGTQNPDR